MVVVEREVEEMEVEEIEVEEMEVEEIEVEEIEVEDTDRYVVVASVVLCAMIVVVVLTNVIDIEFDAPKEFAVTVTDRIDGLLMVVIATPVELEVAYCGLNVGMDELSVKLTTAPSIGLLSSFTVAYMVTGVLTVAALAPLLLESSIVTGVFAAVNWACAVNTPIYVCFTPDVHANMAV